MRRSVVISAVVVGGVVVFGGAVAGLSAATSGKIADGVHVGAVELGGLTPAQAKVRLQREYLAPLQQPVVVVRRGKQFTLTAKEAKVDANLDQTVSEAMKASETGNAVTSAWRTVTGSKVDKNLAVPVEASHDAVVRFVDKVRRSVDRAPEEASLTFVDDRPVVTESKTGMAVDRKKLAKLVTAAAISASREHVLAPVKSDPPKVSAAAIKKDHQTIIVVDRGKHSLRLYKNFKLAKTYSVAVGMQGLETPAGTYTINDKQVDPSWHVPLSDWAGDLAGTVVPPGPSNPIKARWMGFFDGAGIHGTSDDSSIGSSASHGCVRMHVSDVIDLYPRVPLGTSINIV